MLSTESTSNLITSVRSMAFVRRLCMTRSRNHSRREDGRSSQLDPEVPATDISWLLADPIVGGDGWLDYLDEVHDERIGEPGALLRSAERRVRAFATKLWTAWGEQDEARTRDLCAAIYLIASSPISGWTPMNTLARGYSVNDLVSYLGRVGRGCLIERRRALRQVAAIAEVVLDVS